MNQPRKKPSPLDAALALERDGDLAGAEAGYRAIVKKDADHPDALVLLGMLLQKTGRPQEAIAFIERAIAAARRSGRKPDGVWRVALAFARRDSGDVEGALAEIETLLKINPAEPQLLAVKANLLQRLERHEEAIETYRAALKPVPDHPQLLNNLGVSLRAVGRVSEAFEAFHRAVELKPGYAQAAANAGRLLGESGQTERAFALLKRAHDLDRGNVDATLALADILMASNRTREAERVVRRLDGDKPDDPQILVRLGNILMALGQAADAVAIARRAWTLAPEMPAALSLLAEADGEADQEALLASIQGFLAQGQEYAERITLNFAAARLCERLRRHSDTFHYYVEGNAARREYLDLMGTGYNRFRVERRIDALMASLGSQSFKGSGGSDSALPVFIVGMPRSGTTLVEQILASHPDVEGAGELVEMTQASQWLAARHGYPGKLPLGPLKEAATGYLKHVGSIGRGAARVTDKMPANFVHLGLIARMFPRARIIHCRRNPMDNCLSCFAQNFRSEGLAWSCDLEDLAHQYCQYRRIMDHWRAVLPEGMILEVDYEDTVADLEGQARRLVTFVGLEWDSACLDFHKTERAVVTASRQQVRNPVYTSSVGRWKRYGEGVQPLVRALAACGCGPEDKGT